ncbi:2-oxoglutarate synthase subunit KorB [uncultured delta proteobacterium]|uniref:2-oxoglutarate synthase subunit KorB n=1 Tax=uncultured delta proteobacterium TaxID=34034 RepID=A0A212JKR4_9DELT|nr:2-oxoglutarate synthase subunit KorB [uncultured delta proteobacterium]
MADRIVQQYLRQDKLPHIWCAGCGDGTIAGAMMRAIDSLHMDKDNIALITGIGCSARFNNIMDFHSFQTAHGRALAYATGFKMAQPGMDVMVATGDGDCAGIGGNHLIHACRRNINLTVLLINNNIYGMTGGQYSPLTPYGQKAATAKYDTFEYPFDICELAMAAGATYVARSTVYHVKLTEKLIKKAIEHKGFSLVEVISQCPTNYGKRNKYKSPYDMLLWQKDIAVPVEKAKDMTPEELEGKAVIGELVQRTDRKDFNTCYDAMVSQAMAQGGAG